MALSDLEARMTANLYRTLSNAVVTRGAVSFKAFADVQDEQVFERHGVASDEHLRYRLVDAPDFAPNEKIEVNGTRYRIQGDPRRINAQEFVAQIVRA